MRDRYDTASALPDPTQRAVRTRYHHHLNPEGGQKDMSAVITILFLWYIIYRLNKKEYEKKYNKELKFRDTFKPENWEKMH